MSPQVQTPTADSGNKDLQKIQEASLEDLTDTERRIILAMMVSESDREAIKLSPIGERRFYQLKPKLLKVKDQIKNSLADKAWDSLLACVPKAARTLAKGLDQPSYKYQFAASRDILDRVLGKPVQRSEVRSKEAVTVLNINATPQELEGLKHPLSTMEPDNTDSAKALDV